MIKTVLLDDEYPALQTLAGYTDKIPSLQVTGKFIKSSEGLNFILQNKPDLLLMDIQMPKISGIELLSQLPSGQVCVFLTANPEYALKAYELDVIDYVLKPFSFERFEKAIEKATEYIGYKKTQKSRQDDFIMIKADYMIHKIPIGQIKWVEGLSEYIKIVTTQKAYSILMRLSEFEQSYRNLGFVRIHKSYIVHRETVVSFNSHFVKLSNGHELPVGRVYKNNLDA